MPSSNELFFFWNQNPLSEGFIFAFFWPCLGFCLFSCIHWRICELNIDEMWWWRCCAWNWNEIRVFLLSWRFSERVHTSSNYLNKLNCVFFFIQPPHRRSSRSFFICEKGYENINSVQRFRQRNVLVWDSNQNHNSGFRHITEITH